MHYKSLYPPLPAFEDQNVHDFIFSAPAQKEQPDDKDLLIDPLALKKWTKGQFRERVYDCTTALVTPAMEGGLGLAPEGEMVAIMSTNCLEYITLVHSLLRAAIPFALIPASSTAFELQHLFRTSEATRLFVHPSLLPQALEVSQQVGIPEDRIYILEGRVEGRKNLSGSIAEVRKRQVPRVPSRPVTRDTLAYLVFSSGTSGLPKAVMISQRNVLASLIQVAVAGGIEPPNPILEKIQPVSLGFLPIYHTYGLHYVAIRPVWMVLPTVVMPKWNVDTVLELIPKYRVSVLSLTPPAMLQLVNHRRIRETDLSSVVLTGSGAAHLPPKLARTFHSMLKNAENVGEGYGMSEMTISGTRTAPSTFGGPKPGSSGILLPGTEAKIVRDDGTLAGPNEPGELWLRGDNVALGYWRNEKATKETFVDGWVHTGDRFRVDSDQHFFFVERTKDILKVSGAQVSPTEIENVLLAQPEKLILDVTVAGVSGGRTSDEKVPRAWIVLSDEGKQRGAEAVVQALHTWIQKNLSKYKWLRGGIEVVEEIPKNPTGKVLRRVLQDRYEQQQAGKERAKL
ncbi:acetyl-CoA synthetase-like protein [Trametes versicolor FP-101664 SS1]|uniref:acetyl-CoA synthetase-like protein n=1 Tax=Trametes versicolor (strain FP-101664) TaxID=717944 RepID=UPI0004623E59|nr:acetyl-CoA synthetase-like protein [Trametes versicolor FP-101664 SS1]EIW59202.1 acetyl-CoA synthetase-like protein [Trametes versicolor FP-101664 SS1]